MGEPSFGFGGGEGTRVAGGAALPPVANPEVDAALATAGGTGSRVSPSPATCGGGGGGFDVSTGVERSVGGFGRLVLASTLVGEVVGFLANSDTGCTGSESAHRKRRASRVAKYSMAYQEREAL